jgi:DNA-binding transcriptional LysR family regulator
MDHLEAMSIALAVAETGSLSAASRREKTPLATVSRKVSELEAHLETKLFNRTSRALVLTDAGRSFIAAAKRILADVAEVERAASGEHTTPRGDLTISAPVDFGRVHLLPVVAEFLAAFPQVDVDLRLQEREVKLLEEEVDVAVRAGELADSSLIAVRVGDIYRVLCASPGYLKSRGMPKSPDDLARHDCITYVRMRSPDMWTFKREQTEYVVPVHSRLLVSSAQAACDGARAGIGITVALSYHIAEYVKSGELTLLLQDFMPPALPISFVYSPDRYMPAKLRSFLDFALPRLKARLGDLPKGVRPTARGKRSHKA